jgi:hypothetical protein
MAGTYPALPEKLLSRGRERRLAGRFLPLPVVHCRVSLGSGGAALPAALTDISSAGFGLRARRPIAVDTLLTVTLTNTPGLFSCARIAIVRFVHLRPHGDYQIGCQFETPLDRHAMSFLHS